jgi:HD-GYP domain-containing protein (c-di-GMP phosphodiesterase class II)
MWKNPGVAVAIAPSQLVVGLYVWLEMRWDEHPFVANRFMVRTAKDVAVIQSLGLEGHLYYYPNRSTVEPLPLAPAGAPDPEPAPLQVDAQAALAAEVRRLDQAKKDKRQRQRDAAARADRAWEDAARQTREALLTLTRSPKAAGRILADLSGETAARIAQSQEVLLHLLGDKKDQGPQFHALNVLTLCMLVGKKAGLSERELADLAMAALAHDVGKSKVPPQLFKTSRRKRHEEEFVRQHVMYSTQLASDSGAFSKEALACIASHHEAADGSGWPRGQRETHRLALILAMVNRYDNLCSPEARDVEPLMPAEALAHMFRNESGQHDPALLSSLIKLLGVYPPGTVVQLTDGALALVVAPGPESLRPQVLVYTPEIPKDEAPLVELHTEHDIRVAEAIRPSTLPREVLDWLNPQQRLSYFFSVED